MGGTKLYYKMQEQNFSCEEMAKKLSVFQVREETIFQWADGRRTPPAKAKKAIAKLLKCKVSDIF